jgi:hypothetical protein
VVLQMGLVSPPTPCVSKRWLLSTKSFVLATYIVHAILSAVGIGIYTRIAGSPDLHPDLAGRASRRQHLPAHLQRARSALAVRHPLFALGSPRLLSSLSSQIQIFIIEFTGNALGLRVSELAWQGRIDFKSSGATSSYCWSRARRGTRCALGSQRLCRRIFRLASPGLHPHLASLW